MFAALNAFQVGGSTPTFVSDVFSTTLYAGNSSSQTITNGINLSSKGGLVWLKNRTQSASGNFILDNARNNYDAWIFTDTTDAQSVVDAIDPTSSGFSINIGGSGVNASPYNYVSWTFRKQAKFFDIVTYTGNGTNNRAIAHALGSAPGCVIVKSFSNATNWPVYHRSTGANTIFWLNLTNANSANSNYFPTAPDATSFYVGTDSDVNLNGYTYVAYLFAHDAGGFVGGNSISCGSYTGNGSAIGPIVTLGYQPQWLLTKRATGGTGNWSIFDSVRGIPTGSGDPRLAPNTSDAEVSTDVVDVSPTGFQIVSSAPFMNNSGDTYIYIAINAS
jgi:hypothetical protein